MQKRMTPELKISTYWPKYPCNNSGFSGSIAIISGANYPAVPSFVFKAPLTGFLLFLYYFPLIGAAYPKSAIFNTKSEDRKIFSHLISLWQIPFTCIAFRPSTNYSKNWTAMLSGSGFPGIYTIKSNKVSFWASSSAM